MRACGLEFVVSGKYAKTIRLLDEWDADLSDPEAVVKDLRAQGARADLFTFVQRLPHTTPLFKKYRMEFDNVAAIPITTYDDWWKAINHRARTKVRKSLKNGVVVREVPFDDDLVRGITAIYNETPIRQGRPFWHYGKTFEETKTANATFLDRAEFLGAFHGDELIGFVKLVFTENFARTMQILGKESERERAPMNALLARAVERCVARKVPFLRYGKLVYGTKGIDSLAKFKIHNGFRQYDMPRYTIPMSLKGRVVLALHLQNGVKAAIPGWAVRAVLGLRSKLLAKKYGGQQEAD